MDPRIYSLLCLREQLSKGILPLTRVLFVRNLTSLCLYEGKGTGKVLTPEDILKIIPTPLFMEWIDIIIMKDQVTMLTCPEAQVGISIKKERETKSITRKALADKAGVSLELVKALEENQTTLNKTPITLADTEKVVGALGLDCNKINIYPLI